MNIHKTHHDSWTGFLAHLETTPKPCGIMTISSRTSSYSFTGTNSFQEAIDLALSGWPEGTASAKAISEPLFDAISSQIVREDIVYDVEGMSIDIGKYCESEPECWQRIEPVTTDGSGSRLIHLVVNSTVSCHITKDVITRRGATIAALVELLEYAGNRVRLTLTTIATKTNHAVYTTVDLKAYDQPLDPALLAFALAHPSTQRRLFFADLELAPDEYRTALTATYGSPANPADIGEAPMGDIYLGCMSSLDPNFASQDSVTRWLLDTLKQQGVTLKG